MIIEFRENKVNELFKKIKEYGEIKIYDFSINSLILENNRNYIKNIFDWIGQKNKLSSELLYRKSRDGDSYDIFHKLCDNQGKTLTLIKGAENFIVGVYTPINWDNKGGWINDDETFIFSLTNNKIYRKKEKSIESIFCDEDCGPWFGGIGFRENGKKNMSEGEFIYNRIGQEFYGNIDDIIPNEGKSRFFDVEEVEIYKLIFE